MGRYLIACLATGIAVAWLVAWLAGANPDGTVLTFDAGMWGVWARAATNPEPEPRIDPNLDLRQARLDGIA